MTSQKQKHQNSHHIPVLLEAVLALLSPQKGESYLDLTAGYGGHAKTVINLTKAPKRAVLVDKDPDAVAKLRGISFGKGEPRIVQANYEVVANEFVSETKQFDMVLMDLGVSSPQLETDSRGFSFSRAGPLDMRMDNTTGQTAAELINSADEKEIVRIIREYGEEPRSKIIARAIVEARPIQTTIQLASIIERVVVRRGNIHPATRTFQSLRVAVNDELGQLSRTLPTLPDILNEGGRLVIISFHSLEDRLVKSFLLEESQSGFEARLELLNKKPIKGETDDVFNRRSRSARLRGAVKKTNNQK